MDANGRISIFAQGDSRFIGSTDTFGVNVRVSDGSTTKLINLSARHAPAGYGSPTSCAQTSPAECVYEYQDASSGIHFQIVETYEILQTRESGRGGEYCDIHYNFVNLGDRELNYDLMIKMDPIHGNMLGAPRLDGTEITANTVVDFSSGDAGKMICNPQDFPGLTCDVTAIVTGGLIVNQPTSAYYGDMYSSAPATPSFDMMAGLTPVPTYPLNGSQVNYHYAVAWMGNTVAAHGGTYEANTLYGISYPYSSSSVSHGNYVTDEVWIQAGPSSDDGFTIPFVNATAEGLGIDGVSVASQADARTAMDVLGDALEKVSSYRSHFGSWQNRMEHSHRNVLNIAENTQAAESRIRDADMSSSMVDYSRDSIVSQFGQAMLAQANSQREGVLRLLE